MASKRTASIEINESLTDEEYADLVNTLWMVLRGTGYNFAMTNDGRTTSTFLNDRWDEYGRLSEWK